MLPRPQAAGHERLGSAAANPGQVVDERQEPLALRPSDLPLSCPAMPPSILFAVNSLRFANDLC